MEWNTDISKAPKGEMRKTTKAVGKNKVEVEEFAPDRVILTAKCGTVIVSAWNPPTKHNPKGRWQGLTQNEEPIAWMPWPEAYGGKPE